MDFLGQKNQFARFFLSFIWLLEFIQLEIYVQGFMYSFIKSPHIKQDQLLHIINILFRGFFKTEKSFFFLKFFFQNVCRLKCMFKILCIVSSTVLIYLTRLTFANLQYNISWIFQDWCDVNYPGFHCSL